MEFVLWILGSSALALAVGYLIGSNNSIPWHTYHLLRVEWNIRTIRTQLETIKMTQEELAAELTALNATVQKIGTETASLLTKVTDLEAVIAAGGPVSADVQAALDAVKASAAAVDAAVPDAG